MGSHRGPTKLVSSCRKLRRGPAEDDDKNMQVIHTRKEVATSFLTVTNSRSFCYDGPDEAE